MDFPQAVNAANNNSEFGLFKRNIDDVTAYLGRFHLSSRIQTMEQKSGRTTIRTVNCITTVPLTHKQGGLIQP